MSSVSFRITRHTEDLALTIHALSQRVVQLERRLADLEIHLASPPEESPSAEHLASLASVDQLLLDCRELLSVEPTTAGTAPVSSSEESTSPSAEVAPLHALQEVA